MSVSQTLRDAAKIVRSNGWFQKRSRDNHSICAYLALGLVSPYREEAAAFIRREMLQGRSLIEFNDYECESADDVIALFEIGADIAECNERAAIQAEA